MPQSTTPSDTGRPPSVLILGLGNSVLTDDGVGIYTARSIQPQAEALNIEVRTAELAGFALIDLLTGFDVAIVVDAVRLKDTAPGTVVMVDADTMPPSLHLIAGHQVDLPTALALGRQIGIHVPAKVIVVGVQIENDFTFSEEPTAAVKAAIPEAGELALRLAREALIGMPR